MSTTIFNPIPLTACGIESAARLLIHARNSRGSLRSTIRAAIHSDIEVLRRLRHAAGSAA